MKALFKDNWANEYYTWLKDHTSTRELTSGWTEIATPFLDRHNDGITIYLRSENEKIILSDDGYTLSDLEDSGCNMNTQRRKHILSGLLNSLGVSLSGNELMTEANYSNFAQKKHCLIQAILAVNDMFMLSRNQVANIFIEDLTAFLDDNDIRYSSAVHFQGISGLLHRVDFVIPKSKKKPERFISAVNAPNPTNARLTLFNWQDIRPARSDDGILYVFLNDNRKVARNVIDAYEAYQVEPVLWSKRDEYLEQLIS